MPFPNIVTTPFTPRPGKAWGPQNRWHPETGEVQVFHNESDVPEGFLTHHPEDPNHTVQVAPVVVEELEATTLPLSRKEITDALNRGGFEFKKNAQTPALYKQLRVHLMEHFVKHDIEFDANADAKALLELIPSEA